MPFDFTCPSCGEVIEVADEHRGWTMRCPICTSQFQAGETPRPNIPSGQRPLGPWPSRPVEHIDALDDLPLASVAVNREAAFAVVAGPAMFLEIVAWFHLVVAGFIGGLMVLGAVDANQNNQNNPDDIVGMGIVFTMVLVSMAYFGAMAYGARKMRSLSNYGWAMAAGILGTIGLTLCVCGIFMTVAGIWALIVINRPEIRGAFAGQGSLHDRE